MEPAGQILLRNLHDHSPFRQQEVTRAFRKKNHGDFLKFFRGTFKSQGISGVISGASSNSGVFQGFQGFQGSLATLYFDPKFLETEQFSCGVSAK